MRIPGSYILQTMYSICDIWVNRSLAGTTSSNDGFTALKAPEFYGKPSAPGTSIRLRGPRYIHRYCNQGNLGGADNPLRSKTKLARVRSGVRVFTITSAALNVRHKGQWSKGTGTQRATQGGSTNSATEQVGNNNTWTTSTVHQKLHVGSPLW